MWGAFTETLNSAIQNIVPSIPVRNKQSQRTQNKTRYPKNIRNAMSRMHCLWKRHHQNTSDTNIYLACKAAKLNAAT